MKILNIGSGTQIFNPECEDRLRLVEYGKTLERFDILLSCRGNFVDQQISDNTFIHATNSKYNYSRFFDTLRIGSRLAREHKINAIFCQDPLINGFIAWLLAKKYKAKLLVSVFGTNVFDKYWQKEHWYNPILKFLGMIIMKDATLIQTDSFGNFEVLKKIYGNKVFWKPIVPSDIDQYVVDKKEFLPDVVRILFVGRMAKQKNVAMLAKIIEVIVGKDYGIKVELLVIGDGPERKKIEALGEYKNLKLIKNCNRQELNNTYKNNDILILTSFYEGLPRVFVESAANGLAFVVTNVSGAKNIIDENKNGFIIEHNDVDGFVSKLELLISDRGLLEKFSKHTLDNFSNKYYYNLTIKKHKEIMEFLQQSYVK